MAATGLALTTLPAVSAQQSPPAAAQSAEEVQNAPPPERTDTTLRAAPMPVDAMPLDEPPARASAMTRQAPGAGLSQEQWNRRPVAQRGQAPQLEQEWRATDNPNREVVPGEMRSDREGVPAGFTKADADKAETMEATLTTGGAATDMRAMAAPGCQVYWPAPYEVCGAIRDKYNELGGPNSFLLFPMTNELTNPDGIGKRTEFQNGPIYWSPQGGAHPVVNHFLAAWARHGYENSYIGYPTSDELVNPDGIGRRQHFTGSTIYWYLNEAYSVGGAIADKWHSVGAEQGLLGYPISDELVLPDGVGRMNRFQRGVIYWHPATGAHFILQPLLDIWQTYGFETGEYGYPTSDTAPRQGEPGSSEQQFQGGSMFQNQHQYYVGISHAPTNQASRAVANQAGGTPVFRSYDTGLHPRYTTAPILQASLSDYDTVPDPTGTATQTNLQVAGGTAQWFSARGLDTSRDLFDYYYGNSGRPYSLDPSFLDVCLRATSEDYPDAEPPAPFNQANREDAINQATAEANRLGKPVKVVVSSAPEPDDPWEGSYASNNLDCVYSIGRFSITATSAVIAHPGSPGNRRYELRQATHMQDVYDYALGSAGEYPDLAQSAINRPFRI